MSGLLGVMYGMDVIPDDLLYPFGQSTWQQPFNDKYINVSRYDLPDVSITSLAKRTVDQGINNILAAGGKQLEIGHETWFEINTNARFSAPATLAPHPALVVSKSTPVNMPLLFDAPEQDKLVITSGSLPQGVSLSRTSIEGTPSQTGLFNVTLVASNLPKKTREYQLHVYDQNLARTSEYVLFNQEILPREQLASDKHKLAAIFDDNTHINSPTFYSEPKNTSEQVSYGYQWKQPVSISALLLNTGLAHEFSGWFTALNVQYLDNQNNWQTIEQTSMSPQYNFDNRQWLKGNFIDHHITFTPIKTTAIRVQLQSGGVTPDDPNAKTTYYTAINELRVFK